MSSATNFAWHFKALSKLIADDILKLILLFLFFFSEEIIHFLQSVC